MRPRECDQRLTHLPPPDTDSCLLCTARAPVRLGRGSGARMFSVFGRSHVCSEIEQILFSTHDIIPVNAHCRTHGVNSRSMILPLTKRSVLAVAHWWASGLLVCSVLLLLFFCCAVLLSSLSWCDRVIRSFISCRNAGSVPLRLPHSRGLDDASM